MNEHHKRGEIALSADEQRMLLLKRISEAFAKGDLEFAMAYMADDVRWNILGEEDSIIGVDQVLEVSKMQQLQTYPVITISNVVSEGNIVVIESTGKATTQDGRPYNQSYCEVFRFNGDKLQEITTYLDTALSARK